MIITRDMPYKILRKIHSTDHRPLNLGLKWERSRRPILCTKTGRRTANVARTCWLVVLHTRSRSCEVTEFTACQCARPLMIMMIRMTMLMMMIVATLSRKLLS